MNQTCGNCERGAANACGKCQKVFYCGRDCQVAHWKKHRDVCMDINLIRSKYLEFANARIAGNIYIFAAHKSAKFGSGVIFVEIDETIEEFTKGNSMHFAHLKYVTTEDYKAAALTDYKVELSGEMHGPISIVYFLKNYHVVMNITPSADIDFVNLKNITSEPTNEWSILFTL